MMTLLIGIFSGFLACFFSEHALVAVTAYRTKTNFNLAFKAAMGQWMVQIVWIAIAVLCLFFINEYLVLGKHINSLHGLNRGFSMLAALILVFAAYRTIRGRKIVFEMLQRDSAFLEIAALAFEQPIRILIYLSFFVIFGIQWVISAPTGFIFLFLGALFGSFLGWAIFCSSNIVAKFTEKEVKKLLDLTAYLVLVLTIVGLFVVAV